MSTDPHIAGEEVGQQRDRPARNGVSRNQISLAADNDGREDEPASVYSVKGATTKHANLAKRS